MWTLAAAACTLVTLWASVPTAADSEPGCAIVVLEVRAGEAGEAAGLRPGDRLTQWRRAASPPANPDAASGCFAAPEDLDEVSVEETPRGPVTLSVTREGAAVEVTLGQTRWGVAARPELETSVLAAFSDARRRTTSADPDEVARGVEVLRRLADGLGEREPDHAFWLHLRIAAKEQERRHWDAAVDALGRAAAIAESLGDTRRRAQAARLIGLVREDAGDYAGARTAHRQALELRRELAPTSLHAARSLEDMSLAAWWQDLHAEAIRLGLEALALRQSIAPSSRNVGQSYSNLGIVAWSKGDLERAEGFHMQALEVMRRLAPGSLDEAMSLDNLGIVALSRGALDVAEARNREAVAIYARLRPDSVDLGRGLTNLAIAVLERGNLLEAEELLLRVADIYARHGTKRDQTHLLGNRGELELARGDRGAAAGLLRQSLALKEELSLTSGTLPTLRALASATDDPEERRRLLERAMAIVEKETPDSPLVAGLLADLADVSTDQRRTSEARGLLGRALDHAGRVAPKGMEAAAALYRLGLLDARAGQAAVAEGRLQGALAIYSAVASGSQEEVLTRMQLGRVLRKAGRMDEALQMLATAAASLDVQLAVLGGAPETRARFRASFAELHFELIDLLLAGGRDAEAFHALESFRSRELAELLARRDLVLPGVPRELDQRRRMAVTRYRRLLRDARESTAKGPGLQQQLLALSREVVESEAAIRAASPRLARLRAPALDLAGARAALETDTLLLAYVVGDAKTYLFAEGPGTQGLTVHPVPLGRQALAAKVTALRRLVGKPSRLQSWRMPARALGDVLLAPAADRIAAASRILILPDGPLHFVPFAALPVGGKTLAETAPIHFAPSVTVLADLAARRRGGRRVALNVFADPVYPPRAKAVPVVRRAQLRGLDLDPLAGTRDEARRLQALFPTATNVWLGEQATEERAKTMGTDASHIHFACHALVDPTSPFDSGLALSRPAPGAGEDGLLQAWEIFEQLRLDADLVSLSGCDTALGEELAGEGVLGLTRAFHFAGARAVLSTQWKISDAATPALVGAFYRNLRSGMPAAAALQRAQVALLRRARTAHPFYWASFQLHGDWR